MYKAGTNYIILDACRYDYFAETWETSKISGKLSKVNTQVSTTVQWYLKYWSKPNNRILICQNPMPFHPATKRASKNFKKAEMAFGKSWMDISVENTLTKLAANYNENEDYLVHLLPPHLPFVIPEAKTLMEKLKAKEGNIYWETQLWGQRNGFEKLIEYYKKSILQTLQTIKNYLYLFTNKPLVITSDHGELIGEDNYYDHITNPSKGIQRQKLYNVPWLEVSVEDTLIEMRMEMLGYV